MGHLTLNATLQSDVLETLISNFKNNFMIKTKTQNEVHDSVPYQFTASPLNLMYVLDSDCLKMLNLLIQEQSYWNSKGKLVDNYFFKSVNDLKEDMFMSNDQDVRLTLEALYINELIDIIPQGEHHKASQFKLNLEKINEIDKMSITEVKKFLPRICKLRRGTKCSYIDRKDVSSIEQDVPKLSTNCTSISTPKLDNINNKDKSDNLKNKDKVENIDKIENENKIENVNKVNDKNKVNNNIIDENINVENIIVEDVIVDEINKSQVNTSLFISKDNLSISNGGKVVNATTPQAVAQATKQTRDNITNEDPLITKVTEEFDRLKSNDFYKKIYTYSTEELKDLETKVYTLPMSENVDVMKKIKLHTREALKRKAS